MNSIFGFSKLIKFIIKRERIIGTVWIVCLTGFAAALAAVYPGLFSSPEEMMSMAETMNSPGMIAMMGPVYGLDALSPAIVMAHECIIWFMIAAAIMNIFFAARHTRTDEELGRLEMFRSLPVGRLANISSVLFCAFLINLVVTVLTALGILAMNIEGTTFAGAFIYGSAIGISGFLFAGITLLTAQLFTTSRGAVGSSFAAMGLFYVLRASGDMADNILSLISPFGLTLKVYAFYDNNFLPVLIVFAETAVMCVLAFLICSRRDLGEGVIPAKPGKKHASRFLQNPFGLAWRLTRNAFLAWGIALFSIGAMYGSVVGEIKSFLDGNDIIRQMIEAMGTGSSFTDSFVVMMFSIMAIISAVPVINTVMKIRSEEKRGRLEQVYSKSVSRLNMFVCYIIIAFLESAVFLALSAFGLYIASANTNILEPGTVFKAAMIHLPALWVILGLAVLLTGLLPKFTSFIWGFFAFMFSMTYFGRLFDIPDWCMKISPFENTPKIPVEEFSFSPLAVMTGIAVVLVTVGLVTYRNRDVV